MDDKIGGKDMEIRKATILFSIAVLFFFSIFLKAQGLYVGLTIILTMTKILKKYSVIFS